MATTREPPGGGSPRGRTTSREGSDWLAILAGVFGACLVVLGAGVVWVTGGAERVAPAIPLWVAGLAALAVALGRGVGLSVPPVSAAAPDGGSRASVRRQLSLSERLALGALGGCLGGIVVAMAVWVTTRSGLTRALGSTIAGVEGWFGLGARIGTGVAWGLAFGVLYRWLPGRGAASRGVFFALAAALYALLYEFPVLREVGWFGVELGATTFLFVILYHLLWGLALAAVFQWAEVTSEGALDRPLVA